MGLGDEHPEVVIVGAGVAGLYAGRCLHRAGVSVLIVEAQPRIGGRIRQVEGLAPWPVEVGPEFVHGSKSLLKEVLMDEMGCTAREKEWPDWYFLGSCRKLLRAADAPAQVEQLHDRFANVGKLPLPEQDESAEAWLRREGVPEEMVELADSCYANDFGCSLDRLGMRELVLENRRWDSGEEYLILDRSFSHMVTHLAKGLHIRTGWPVHRIAYGPGHVALHGPGGQILRARRAICTVPLRILQQPDQLSFHPPLPPAKLEAANRIKMDRAIKVLVTVSERFWPPGLYDVVCTGSFVPEFWILTAADKPFDTAAAAAASPSSTASVAQDVVAVIAGFACGRHAERLASLRTADVVRKFLAQLDEIFGTEARRRPATRAFLRGHTEDWAQERFVDGAYSYPSVGAHAGDRDALATPLMNTLFFAGEATHSAINPCLQAAMETGERAALQVQDSLGRSLAPLSKL